MIRSAAILLLAVLPVLATGCKKKPDTAAGGGSGGDSDKLQGTWAIESFDDGEPARPADLEDAKRVRFQFEGNKLTIHEGGADTLTFTLDESQDPKVMTLTEAGDTARPRGVTSSRGSTVKVDAPPPEPEKMVWIYKFDGDALVIAFSKKGEKPTEFKARKPEDGPRVVVITLKKTDAPPPPRRSPMTTAWRGTKK